ncbi:hypothetical protein BP5796_08781 [Coleophoma crateriformis]|uniref:Ankyrin repeat protein n=1 Tax=Coleophoma crateriformis TaxID=565419 RepID=A0A3D8R946_9HELO|nr:hypothetical protein BP5796_08781 [Coleophoma crateriformis]
MSSVTSKMELPKLPSPSGSVKDFIPFLSGQRDTPIAQIIEPYKAFESELRKIYAQQPDNEAVKDGHINMVPIFGGQEELKIRARSLDTETEAEKSRYIMELKDKDRKPNGSPAVVSSIKDFQKNFNLFSESSLADLDWSNIVAAGSSVTTALLPVPEKWAGNKRSLREYYHEHLAPASDVDLFIYGLDEHQALEKIKLIERNIKDSILHETTTIRTKHAITIASQHPTRHVQVVLRLYDSISQIITGFDVDCACVAYDGKQVFAAPRAIAAFVTQCNTIDLTRRSPSYENRLSKYSHRGFEVHWPLLDRSRVDPTIFERSFGRTQGLARLLILEKLPKAADRDAYMFQRRAERGRPALHRNCRNQYKVGGNIKDQEEDDVAEWVNEAEVASYHTMTIPYGPKYHAARINRLLYAKDLLLNAQWNQPDDREVYLHRHPCFFGTAEEVLQDCCGFCPQPVTDQEIEIAEEESKTMISGELKFLVDDPGRQEIGSFNPITDDEWTTMAYVGDTARLCQAIVDCDLEHVEDWCSQAGVDVNQRDYTGRTPLHLATMASSIEIVACLINHGARLIARLVDGRTALHIAAARGNISMVRLLMLKSNANEAEEEERAADRRDARAESMSEASEISLGSDTEDDSVTMGSFIKVDKNAQESTDDGILEDSSNDPDIYDIDVTAWDYGLSPLHLAILNGHENIIKELVSEYGADVLLPVKLFTPGTRNARGAILSILLALFLPVEKSKRVLKLLLELGATSTQADTNLITGLHYLVSKNRTDLLDVLLTHDRPAALSVVNNVSMVSGWGNSTTTPLVTAIERGDEGMAQKLLEIGAQPTISFDDWIKSYASKHERMKRQTVENNLNEYHNSVTQPILVAAYKDMGNMIEKLMVHGADPATLGKGSHSLIQQHRQHLKYYNHQSGESLLDIVQTKLKLLREYREPQNIPRIGVIYERTSYTDDFIEGSYSHWSATADFHQAKQNIDNQWAEHLKAEQAKTEYGVAEKQQAISDKILELEHAEKSLVEAGARTFADMYPDVPKSERNKLQHWAPAEPTPYETKFTFQIPNLNKIVKDGYLRLFEAVWDDDFETIKKLTLAPWASAGQLSEASLNPPLQIAVKDGNGFSPFSLAVLRGHFDLARKVIEICMAQYHKDDGKTNRQRWNVRTADSDDEISNSDDEDDLPISSELVNNEFTVDSLGQISNIVKSDVLPLTMIEWSCRSLRFDSLSHSQNNLYTLLEHAVMVDDLKLLRFLIEIGTEQQRLAAGENDDLKCYTINKNVFSSAIRLGRTAMLSEMIRATGVGIPLNALSEKSGVEIKSIPKYYEGLSVAGKKRADWAQAPGSNARVVEERITPLLQAAHVGSLDSVEFFMSATPARKYQEFAQENKHDKRIKALEQSGTGFEKTLKTWLSEKSELVLHCAILHNPDKESTPSYLELIKHLVSSVPEYLEKKSSEGWTPLHVAVLQQRHDVASYLISCGADQRSRDRMNRNLIHHSVCPRRGRYQIQSETDKLESMIEILDAENVKEMMLERCAHTPGALTPLAYWMAKRYDAHYTKSNIIAVLCKHSDLQELEMINGAGDLPLHVAIKEGLSTITSFFLSLKPTLLYRENATGRTPLEMSHEIYIASCVENPLAMPARANYYPGSSNQSLIVSKPAEAFVRTGEVQSPEESKKRTWKICEGIDEQVRGGEGSKRRLVSLFEANEIAKRVAGRNNNGGRGSHIIVNGGIVDGDVKMDVVSEWMG